MTIEIDIERASPLWSALPGFETLVRRAVLAAAKSCGVVFREGAELSVQLTDDRRIRALNAQWRGQDKPTDVLSFPVASRDKLPAAPLLGDIVIAYETAQREAQDEGLPLAEHLAHLVVHGFLHLVGFDHQDAADAERMEGLEVQILKTIGLANPYAENAGADELR